MTNHPITLPPTLIHKWARLFITHPDAEVFSTVVQWGADQELDACCEWVSNELSPDIVDMVRAARRPKPPSLKEQGFGALELLKQRTTDPNIIEPLTRALEQLND
jgi:hypothetical protein